jgi:hypothetical protein
MHEKNCNCISLAPKLIWNTTHQSNCHRSFIPSYLLHVHQEQKEPNANLEKKKIIEK